MKKIVLNPLREMPFVNQEAKQLNMTQDAGMKGAKYTKFTDRQKVKLIVVKQEPIVNSVFNVQASNMKGNDVYFNKIDFDT